MFYLLFFIKRKNELFCYKPNLNEARHSNRIAKLIKDARFRDKACIEELDMDNARGIDTGVVAKLGTWVIIY